MGGSSSKHLVRKIGETLASEESYKLTPSDLKRLWSHYDADKSGFLSRDELRHLYRDFFQATLDRLPDSIEKISFMEKFQNADHGSSIDSHFDEMDTDGDGRLSKKEFLDNIQILYDAITGPSALCRQSSLTFMPTAANQCASPEASTFCLFERAILLSLHVLLCS